MLNLSGVWVRATESTALRQDSRYAATTEADCPSSLHRQGKNEDGETSVLHHRCTFDRKCTSYAGSTGEQADTGYKARVHFRSKVHPGAQCHYAQLTNQCEIKMGNSRKWNGLHGVVPLRVQHPSEQCTRGWLLWYGRRRGRPAWWGRGCRCLIWSSRSRQIPTGLAGTLFPAVGSITAISARCIPARGTLLGSCATKCARTRLRS